jgi:hypothetical protein
MLPPKMSASHYPSSFSQELAIVICRVVPHAHRLGGLSISILNIISVKLAVLAISRISALIFGLRLHCFSFVALAALSGASWLALLSWLLGCLWSAAAVCR